MRARSWLYACAPLDGLEIPLFMKYMQIELWKSTVWMMSSATDHAFWSIKMRVLETSAECTLERTCVAGSLRKPLDKSCRCAQMADLYCGLKFRHTVGC